METSGTPIHQTLVQQGHRALKLTLNLPYFGKKIHQDILSSLTFKKLQQDTSFFFRGDIIISTNNLEFISSFLCSTEPLQNITYDFLPSLFCIVRQVNKREKS